MENCTKPEQFVIFIYDQLDIQALKKLPLFNENMLVTLSDACIDVNEESISGTAYIISDEGLQLLEKLMIDSYAREKKEMPVVIKGDETVLAITYT